MDSTINEKEINTKDNSDEEVTDQEIDSNLEAVQDENNMDESNNQLDDMKDLEGELQDYKHRFTRLSADFQNYKKRAEKEKSDIYKFGSEKIVIDILPVIDNFERAIEAAKNESEQSEGLLDGIEMILKQLVDVLEKHGVKEIEALEKEFDPNFHHAVMQEECPDIDSNIITEVFQKGYSLNSKVIRPSMVKVAK